MYATGGSSSRSSSSSHCFFLRGHMLKGWESMIEVNVPYIYANSTVRLVEKKKRFPSTDMFLTLPGEESGEVEELSVCGG